MVVTHYQQQSGELTLLNHTATPLLELVQPDGMGWESPALLVNFAGQVRKRLQWV